MSPCLPELGVIVIGSFGEPDSLRCDWCGKAYPIETFNSDCSQWDRDELAGKVMTPN